MFPRYNSQAKATTQISKLDTRPQEVMREGTADKLDILGQAAGQVADITMKWAQAVDSMQETAVKSSIAVGLAQIKQDSLNDPEINNEKLQIDRMKKLRQAAMGKGLQNKSLEQKLNIELDTQEQLAALEINNIYAKKKIDYTRNVTLPNVIESYHQIKQSSVYNSPQWVKADTDLREEIEKQRVSGIIDYETAGKLYKQEQELGVKENIAKDTATEENQSQVLKDLRDTKGRYAFLDSKQRLELIEDSQRRIFQNNQSFKRDITDLQNERTNNLINKVVSEGLTIADIETELAIPEEKGGMKRATLLTYQRAALRGIENDLNRILQEKTPDKNPTQRAIMVKKYNDLIDDFMDDKTDQWKAKELLAQAYADGIINPKEQQFLNNLKQGLKGIEWNRSTNPLVNIIKGTKEFLRKQSNATDEVIALRMKQLVGGIISGEDPLTASKKVMSDEIKSVFPDYATYPKEGRIKIDNASGRQYKVYPDGSWEWIIEKSSGVNYMKSTENK